MTRFILLISFALFASKVSSQTTPESNCNATGDKVCIDCNSVGTCQISSPDPFEVVPDSECVAGEFCDNTLLLGTCIQLNPADTECDCVTTTTCHLDPNDDGSLVTCDGSNTIENCGDPSLADTTTCTCLTSPASTTTTSTTITTTSTPSSTTASSTSASSSSSSSASSSPSSTDSSSTSSSPSSTDSSSTSSSPSSTNSSSTSSLPSSTNSSSTSSSPSSTDSSSTTSTTSSTSSTSTSTSTTTTVSTTTADPCAQCGYVDNPNDSCSLFYICDGDTLVPAQCPGTTCFDQTTCQCLTTTPAASSTTSSSANASTTTANPCAQCGYVDNPNDSCSMFYICDGETLVPSRCPGTLCFDQASCRCQ